MLFYLSRTWFTKAFGSKFFSFQQTNDKSPEGGFRSIGGGGSYESRKGRGPASTDPMTMTFTESEERIMNGVSMQSLKSYPASAPPSDAPSSSAIMLSNQIDITHETRSSRNIDQAVQDTREVW